MTNEVPFLIDMASGPDKTFITTTCDLGELLAGALIPIPAGRITAVRYSERTCTLEIVTAPPDDPRAAALLRAQALADMPGGFDRMALREPD